MAIIRWDPFREMTQVQNQFNRLVDQVWGGRQESWLPAVDVFDTKEAVVLKAELAGMNPDDIQIEVEDNVLTIKGERKFEEWVDDERYHRIERRFGSFQRSLALPQGVKANEIAAGYEDGILTVMDAISGAYASAICVGGSGVGMVDSGPGCGADCKFSRNS
jgi:HSP20 family protein